jgi:tetratricopeptide (TPR) repeat protein
MTTDIVKNLFEHAMSEFLKGNYEKSLELLDKVLELEPDHKLALTTRGAAALKMNRPDAAVESFNRSLEADPAYAKAYHMRGLAFESKGDHRAALNDFNKAIELNPQYGAAYHSRGTLYARMGQEELAAEDIQTMAHLTNLNIETFANEHNVWRSNQLRVEDMLESEMHR